MRTLLRSSALVLLMLSVIFVGSARAAFFWANPQPTGNALHGIAFENAASGYAVGAMGTALHTTDGGVTWQVTSSPDALSPQLEDLIILAPGVLLAAGEAPGIHNSTNGGATWTAVPNPANGTLRNLFRLDGSTIFAVGDNGRALRSTDGGANFVSLTSLSGQLDDQYWKDAQTGYVLGQFVARRTTNGGQTWLPIPNVPEGGTFFGGDISFFDANNGWIVNDFETYRTTDGGANWFDLNHQFQGPIYQDVCLPLSPQTRIVASNGEGAQIWKTTNDGASWTMVLSHNGTTGIPDLDLLPDGSLVAVSTAADLLRSTDAGNTWTNFTRIAGPPDRSSLNAIDVIPSGIGFAGGWSSNWVATSDGGRNWFNPPATPGLQETFAITVRDPQFILAGGVGTNGHSDVRRSTDGGVTWTTHSLSANYTGYPEGLVALPDGTCYCATAGGTGINYVFRSTDGGTTWHQRNNGVPASNRLNDIQFLDPLTGFVCGGDFQSPVLYRTTDGGGTWTPVGTNGLLMAGIQDMHWHDAQNGIVIGDSRIQRTTNGGASWTTVVGDGGWAALDFRDPLHGVATELDEAVRLTTDGGATWARQALPAITFLADVVATPDGYIVVGDTSQILGWSDSVASVESPSESDAGPLGGIPPHRGGPSDARGCIFWPNPYTVSARSGLSFRAERADAEIRDAVFFDPNGRRLGHGNVTLDGAAGTPGFTQGRISLADVRLPSGSVRIELHDVRGNRYAGTILIIR